jgi:hypothetical protein
VTSTADTNELERARAQTDDPSAPSQARDCAGQLGQALRGRDHRLAGFWPRSGAQRCCLPRTSERPSTRSMVIWAGRGRARNNLRIRSSAGRHDCQRARAASSLIAARSHPGSRWRLRRAAAPCVSRALPVTGRPPSRPPNAPTRGEAPSSRRSSLEPIKITVKSASCAPVLRMALRATLDSDLVSTSRRLSEGWPRLALPTRSDPSLGMTVGSDVP